MDALSVFGRPRWRTGSSRVRRAEGCGCFARGIVAAVPTLCGGDLSRHEPDEPNGGGARLHVGQAGRASQQPTTERDVDERGPRGHLLPRPGCRLLLRAMRLRADSPEGTAHRQYGICERAGTHIVEAPVADLVRVAHGGRDELGPADRRDDHASVGSVEGDSGLPDEIPVLEPQNGPFVPQVERLARADHRERTRARPERPERGPPDVDDLDPVVPYRVAANEVAVRATQTFEVDGFEPVSYTHLT